MHNIRNESGEKKTNIDKFKEINELYKISKQHKVHNSQSNNNTESSRKDGQSYVLKVPKKSKESFLRLPFEKVDNYEDLDQQNKTSIGLIVNGNEADNPDSKIEQDANNDGQQIKKIQVLTRNQKESSTAC